MTETNKTIRRISPDELDDIIAQIAYDGDTELALLGPDPSTNKDLNNWPTLWRTSTHVYQLTQHVDNLIKRISILNHLTSLSLASNNIGNNDLKHIIQLNNLISLDLNDNNIGDNGIEYICVLTKLRSLKLNDNNLGDDSIQNIVLLKDLSLLEIGSRIPSVVQRAMRRVKGFGRNDIGDQGAQQLVSLRKLTSLNLSYQKDITDLKPFSVLSLLSRLDITDTNVTDLSPFKQLIKHGVPVLEWGKHDSDGIFVEGCPLIHPPPEIVQQGPEAVRNYFREIESQGIDHLYEAKVLIVGEGRAGKTSLMRRLYHPNKPLPVEDETTKGIDIHRHDFPLDNGRTFRLNVWDFGGQQIYHATHQFFLTKNSLYILLDDTAKDHKSITDEGFRYWLEVIDLLSNHSPVLIFQNEKGGRSKRIDEAGIKGRFPNVKDVYRGNLEYPGSADALSKAAELYVQQLPHVGEEVPAKWVEIRKTIEQKAQDTPYISQQDYFALYGQHLEFDRSRTLHLSRYFHDLGVFLHFQDDPLLRKTVILQNRWATEAVFRILDDEMVKMFYGRFTTSDCERIWADSEYADMHAELLALMEKFELCYALPDLPASKDKTWLAPQLLPPSVPAEITNWAQPGDLVLSYRYDFLPKGLINRLMVRKHAYVQRTEMAWINGVLFECDGSSLLAQVMPCGNEITLRARGSESKMLMSIIAADLDALNASFSGLQAKLKKWIPCRCSQCSASITPELFEYDRLRKRKRDGKLEVECPASYEMVNVLALLDGFRLEDYSPREGKHSHENHVTYSSQPKTVSIFLASSEELRDDRDAFDLYFRQQNDSLRKKGVYLEIIRWENFLDAMSETRLQDEYNKKVRDCDIFVSLFMTKTGAYTEEEFDVAYDTFKQNGKPLIYTYFKDAAISTTEANRNDLQSLWTFQDKLKAKGHFWTEYKNIEHLRQHFRDQIDKLLDDGRI